MMTEDERFPPIINCTGQIENSSVTGILDEKELEIVRKMPPNVGLSNLFAVRKTQNCYGTPNKRYPAVSYFQHSSDQEELTTEIPIIGAYCHEDDCPNRLG